MALPPVCLGRWGRTWAGPGLPQANEFVLLQCEQNVAHVRYLMGTVWEQIERSPWLVARSVIKFRQRAGPALKSVINTWPQTSSSSFAHLFCSFHNKFPATWALCAWCILASYQELDCNSIYCRICHAKRLLGRKREWLKQDRPTARSPQPQKQKLAKWKRSGSVGSKCASWPGIWGIELPERMAEHSIRSCPQEIKIIKLGKFAGGLNELWGLEWGIQDYDYKNINCY